MSKGKNLLNEKIRLSATLTLKGKTATGLIIPEEVVIQLGAGKKPKITATVNGYTYRTSIALMHGEFLLPVSAEVRENAKVKAGDIIKLEIELDNAPREVEVPDDLMKVLKRHPKALEKFNNLSFSNKRGFVTPVETAKTSDTRERRIQKVIQALL